MLDYRVNKNAELAAKIFQSGMEKIASSDVNFLDSYLRFLISINDMSNLRLAIERAVKDSEKVAIEARQKQEDEKLRDKVKRRKTEVAKVLSSAIGDLWSFGVHAGAGSSPESTLSALSSPQAAPLSLLDTVPANSTPLGLVWRYYVEAERWMATDVAAIEKAELRREVALNLSLPTIARLCDRYRFQDLWPISQAQRALISRASSESLLLLDQDGAAINLNVPQPGSASSASSSSAALSVHLPLSKEREIKRAQHPKMNLSSLIAFDPSRRFVDRPTLMARYGAQLDEAIIFALLRMPPPIAWHGPTYRIDDVMTALSIAYPTREAMLSDSVEVSSEAQAGDKRKREENNNEDGDLFKQRRQQKLSGK